MNPSATNTIPSSRRSRRWAILVAVLLTVVGATFLLSQRVQTNTPEGARGKKKGGGAIPVGIAPVEQGDIGVYLNALGTVTPVYSVTVTSRVTGQLMEVHYREGQIVHKGELLAVIDPRPYQATVMQAEGQLARDRATLKNSYIDLDRYKLIYAQKAIPEQTLATQQAVTEQNEGTVKVDQGNLEAAKVNLEYARITAPIDGRVGLRLVDPGNIVQANGTSGILTIAQLQPITVVFTIAEDYVSEVSSQLRAGHKLVVDALDRSNQSELAKGTVLTIDNAIDTTTGTVKVRSSFGNKDYRLFPNEFVNARLLLKTLHKANLISTAAIQRNNDLAYVYVVDATNSVKMRNIKIATTDGNIAAVTGVNPGEKVVTDGFDRLQDGVKVAVRTTTDESPGTTPPSDQDKTGTEGEPKTQGQDRGAGAERHNARQANPK